MSDGSADTTRKCAFEDEAAEPATRPVRAGRGVAVRAGKVVVAGLAGLVFLVSAAGWSGLRWIDGRLQHITALDPGSSAIDDADGQRGDENVLLVGSDTRVGVRAGDQAGDAEAVPGARSDTVMIAHLAADRSRAVVVSFPRDLQISRPPCAVWDPVTGAYRDEWDPGAEIAKLNSAYEIGGPLCLTRVVQQISGLAVTRYLGVDFQGFKSVVDAVGGVPLCVERPLHDRELGVIVPAAGHHRLTGPTALAFVRARHILGDPTSDYGRIVRQQRFAAALLRELLSPDMLLNPGRLHRVVEAVATNTMGENISTHSLLQLASSVRGMDPSDVVFVTVPTTGEANEHGNEELRLKDAAALFRAIIDGTPLPGERPDPAARPVGATEGTALARAGVGSAGAANRPAPAMVTAAAPGDVMLRVLNGNRVAGSAGRAAEQLRAAGFTVVGVGDAEVPVDATLIRYPPDLEAQALTLHAALPDAVLQPDQALTGTTVLVVGPDFDGVHAPPANASLAEQAAPPPLDSLNTVNGADIACG